MVGRCAPSLRRDLCPHCIHANAAGVALHSYIIAS